jgi:hypothetical protein
MRPLFLITSYNRKGNLKKIVNLLKSRNLDYIIFDDGSSFNLADPNFIKHEHRGKPGFWLTWKEMFRYCQKQSQYTHFAFLQDDMQSIQIDKILSLMAGQRRQEIYHIYNDGRDRCWLDREPQPVDDSWRLVFFVDCVFICHRWLLHQLDYKILPIRESRFERNPLISSGVGQQLTLRLRRVQCRIFQPHFGKSLADHGFIKSKMNPDARDQHKLKTK